VSAKEQIAKLEALLARVSSRANAPRIVASSARSTVAPVASVAPVAPVAAPTPPAPPVQLRDPAPPPAPQPPAPPPPVVVAVKTPDVEAPEIPAAAKSDARLIAAKAVDPLDFDAAVDSTETLHDAHLETISVDEAAPDVEVLDAPEDEPAPSSSRRPISPPPAEEIAETAFGADDLAPPPRHTPPPESGRLPAAPELAPVIDADDEVEDITGVHHSPASPASPAGEGPAAAAAAEESDALAKSGEHEGLSSPPDEITPPPAVVSRVELTPHVARPERTASAPVADAIGQAMAFAPATFGELLDATLAL